MTVSISPPASPPTTHAASIEVRDLVVRYGTVTAVRCESINVPQQFRAAVPLDRPSNALTVALARKQEKRPFTVQVAFGKRLEPWIMSAHAGST